MAESGHCLDTLGHRKQNETIGISKCHNFGGNQFFIISENDEIRVDTLCVDASQLLGPIMLWHCHGEGGNQKWVYDNKVSKMKSVYSLILSFIHFFNVLKAKTFRQNEVYCLTLQEDADPTLEFCDGSVAQQWILRKPQIKLD